MNRRTFQPSKSIYSVAALILATGVLTATSSAAAPPDDTATARPSTSKHVNKHANTTKITSIRGHAKLAYPVLEDDVRVSVNARARYVGDYSFPERSWGTFRIYHRVAEPEPGADPFVNWGDFKVDCLTTGGPTATVTGTLIESAPGSPWPDGMKTGLSFYISDGRQPSRVGIAGAHEPALTSCMAPAADTAVVTGGFTVRASK